MVKHPAKFGTDIIYAISEMLSHFEPRNILDPFAGTGRVHLLEYYGHKTTGVELEPEWAEMDHRTIVGNALYLPFRDNAFNCVVTSPTYGNRYADHHNAKDDSVRRSYTFDIGHKLHEDNSGAMHWGKDYRSFHIYAWREALRVLDKGPHSVFILNVKDHPRNGVRQPVSDWHVDTLESMGLRCLDSNEMKTSSRGMRYGANRQRFNEMLYLLEWR